LSNSFGAAASALTSPLTRKYLGRYGNRIAKGQFTLDGKQYQIPVNNRPNAVHGGTKGFDKELWSASPIEGPNWVGIELNYFSPDEQMGFPRSLAVTVRYTLDSDNDLRIHYSAIRRFFVPIAVCSVLNTVPGLLIRPL
jgi:aldose 1-epimerase